jgi:TolB-like protein
MLISCSPKQHTLTLSALPPIPNDIVISKSYTAADELNRKLNLIGDSKKYLIIITTFGNNDHLDTANTLSRLIPYLIGSRLAQLGYKPVDLRLRENEIAIKKKQGEFILTRDSSKIKETQRAAMILTGHFSVLYNKIYIHAEIVSAKDKVLLASYDFTLPLQKPIKSPPKPIIPSVITNNST